MVSTIRHLIKVVKDDLLSPFHVCHRQICPSLYRLYMAFKKSMIVYWWLRWKTAFVNTQILKSSKPTKKGKKVYLSINKTNSYLKVTGCLAV